MKSRRLLFVTLLAGTGIWVSGCDYRHDKGDPQLAQDSASWYETVRERVFVPSCVSCHGNSGGVNLESYAAIQKNLDRIYRATIATRTMPKGGALDPEAYAMLSEWLEAGAPIDRPSKPRPSPSPDEPLKATFVSIKSHIFKLRCYGCHGPGGQAEHIPLSTLADLIDSPRELVIPGDSADSGLFIAVSRQDGKRMPPPDSGASALSSAEIGIIQSWIDSGAPEGDQSRMVPLTNPGRE